MHHSTHPIKGTLFYYYDFLNLQNNLYFYDFLIHQFRCGIEILTLYSVNNRAGGEPIVK
ncbi:hypothetical protein LEP1GSC120_1158 [Leptospira santarosai str. 200702252]|nr:hypothetical protein LEP1GSC071_3385 [Leptospira santarosai str. JET]EMO72792.1 hypothetical protein LEP1GSC130_0564 [Leptospira santarosai str. 200403458]EMO99774.1 hypothetical protein LEP1GSC120_1158 [Leptospira santarosai str. 200702252]